MDSLKELQNKIRSDMTYPGTTIYLGHYVRGVFGVIQWNVWLIWDLNLMAPIAYQNNPIGILDFLKDRENHLGLYFIDFNDPDAQSLMTLNKANAGQNATWEEMVGWFKNS